MSQPRRIMPLPLGGEHGLPYSRGLMARALMAVGIPVAAGVIAWQWFTNHLVQYLVIVPVCTAVAIALMFWQLEAPERDLLRDVRARFQNQILQRAQAL